MRVNRKAAQILRGPVAVNISGGRKRSAALPVAARRLCLTLYQRRTREAALFSAASSPAASVDMFE
jgi:hypothetical protein